MNKTLKKIALGSALVTGLAGCMDFGQNKPVQGMYAGMEAIAISKPLKSVSLRSKNNYVTLFAVDDNQNRVFDENEMLTEVTPPNWESYNPEDLRRGFYDKGPYINPDSLEAVYKAVIGGNR